ncbi:MAG: MFS transporter [Chloroflexota bacterium]|nr:MFS transporter [Chloroflexota bacterium]
MTTTVGGRPRGWHVVAVGFLAMVAGTPVGPAGFAIFLLPMSDDLGWGRDLLGGGVAAGTLAGALVAPWVGRMVDRHGARAMLTLGGLGLGASYIGLSLVPPSAPWLFYLAYGLGRLIDMAVILLGATVAVSAWFSEQRGRAIGLVLSGNPIGVLLLVPLVQLVILESGWRPAWLVLGLTSWLVLVPAAWLLVRSPADVTDGRVPEATGAAWTVRRAVRTRVFWSLLVSATLGQMAYSAAGTHQIAFLRDKGIDAPAAVAAIAVFAATWGAGQFVWGFMADRVPARRLLAAGYGLLAVALFLLSATTTFGGAIAYALIFGIALSNHEAVDAVAWADAFGTRALGAIRGAGRPLFLAGNAAGAVMAGLVFELGGSYAPAFWLLGALAIAAAVLVAAPRAPLTRS